jgi:drug/metabolite transporter (DMT)-like permease
VNVGVAVGFALLSFLFAGLNDLVFKRYAVSARSSGMLVLGIGVVWTAIQLLVFGLLGRPLRLDAATLAYGGLAGALLVVSNLLLIESLRHVELSLGSTIYRLNTVAVAVLSFVVLEEPLGATKLSGIGLGVLAVLLLSHRPAWHPPGVRHHLFVAAVVVAALLRATYGVVTRKAMLDHLAPEPLLLVVSATWILGGAAYALARDGRLRLTREKVGYSAVSGTLVFLIVYALLRAVQHGQASVVIPIANMSFLVALAISVATRLEPLTARKAAAALVAVGAILLLSRA